MGCTDCTKAYELIELPVVHLRMPSSQPEESGPKTYTPISGRNRPGWKGRGEPTHHINVAIDHLLQCDGAGSLHTQSSGANRKSVSEAEVPQVFRQAKEALRQAMEAMRKATMPTTRKRQLMRAWRGVVERPRKPTKKRGDPGATRVEDSDKGLDHVCRILCSVRSPAFLYLTTTLFSSDQVDASNQELTSFTLPSGIPQSEILRSSPTQAAPVIEDARLSRKTLSHRKPIPVTSSPTPVSPAARRLPHQRRPNSNARWAHSSGDI